MKILFSMQCDHIRPPPCRRSATLVIIQEWLALNFLYSSRSFSASLTNEHVYVKCCHRVDSFNYLTAIYLVFVHGMIVLSVAEPNHQWQSYN